MNYQSKCDHCGHTATAYIHTINQPLVNSLNQLVGYYERTRQPANLQKHLNLTKNQYNNFQKLQYFGVVQRTQHGWYPTQLGVNFIYGIDKIYSRVATVESDILPINHPVWKEQKKFPVLLGVQDIDWSSYKTRMDYQQERSNQYQLV